MTTPSRRVTYLAQIGPVHGQLDERAELTGSSPLGHQPRDRKRHKVADVATRRSGQLEPGVSGNMSLRERIGWTATAIILTRRFAGRKSILDKLDMPQSIPRHPRVQ